MKIYNTFHESCNLHLPFLPKPFIFAAFCFAIARVMQCVRTLSATVRLY